VSYLKSELTREEFFDKVYKKGQSLGSRRVAEATVRHLDRFCEDKFQKELDPLLTDMRNEIDTQHNDRIALKFLDDFNTWLGQDHPTIRSKPHLITNFTIPLRKKGPSAIRTYFSYARKYRHSFLDSNKNSLLLL